MKAEELRALQAPLKQRYRDQPEAAVVTLKARSRIGEGNRIRCHHPLVMDQPIKPTP